MAWLRYLDDDGHLQAKALDSDPFSIGRAPACGLTLESEMISREHVRIEREGDGRYRIRDLGSRNKTHVNGELIRETLLTSGSIVRVGDRVVEFLDDDEKPQRLDMEFLTPDTSEPPNCEWAKLKAPLSLTMTQMETLSRLISDQPLTTRVEDIADVALARVILQLDAERGLIALRGKGKAELHILAHRSLRRPPAGSMTPVSQSFLLAPILQKVAGRYPQTAGQISRDLGYAGTGIAVPLIHRSEVIGVLYVDRPVPARPFDGAALQYCLAAGAHIGALLGESARRLSSDAGREGATWVSILRRLQATLTSPVTSSATFDAASHSYPGRMRCGDFGSVIHVDEQRCGLVVIDGGGHGVTGLTQAAAIRSAVHSTLAVSDDALVDPAVMFNALNQLIASSGARQVLPCTFVGVDLTIGKLAYVNAGGMPPLLMVAPGRLVTLDQLSLVLGVDPNYHYDATRVDLPRVFQIVCHTDGLSEATNAAGEALGEQRLHNTLLDPDAFASAAEVIARIAETWTTHMSSAQPADDALALAVGHR